MEWRRAGTNHLRKNLKTTANESSDGSNKREGSLGLPHHPLIYHTTIWPYFLSGPSKCIRGFHSNFIFILKSVNNFFFLQKNTVLWKLEKMFFFHSILFCRPIFLPTYKRIIFWKICIFCSLYKSIIRKQNFVYFYVEMFNDTLHTKQALSFSINIEACGDWGSNHI